MFLIPTPTRTIACLETYTDKLTRIHSNHTIRAPVTASSNHVLMQYAN